jgi:hypothetical protein
MTCLVHARVRSSGLFLAVFAAAALTTGDRPAVAADSPTLYAKKGTWTETMLQSRANYVRLVQQERQRSGNPNAKPFTSEPITGEGPGQQVSVSVAGCRWMRLVAELERGGGNCHIWGDARLVAKDGTVTLLSKLNPVFIRVGWGRLLIDKNWQDHPLVIGTRKFEHGIWVHANSNICYALDGKYERFEAWVGMDADRANGVARFKVLFEDPDLLPEMWKQIAADFPVQAAAFAEDGGGNYLGWFDDESTTRYDQAVVQHLLGQLGSAAGPARKEFDELVRNKVPGQDRRWLDLYLRLCRCRDAREPMERIWIAELRRLLDVQYEELLRSQAALDDPRWEQLKAKTSRAAEALSQKPSGTMDLVAMRTSIETMAKALPGRFAGADKLLAQMDDQQRRWQAILPGVAQGEAKALQAVSALAEEARSLRRTILLGLKGMPEFLAVPAHAGMDKEWAAQFESLQYDVANRAHFAQVAKETFRPEASIQEADRDPVDVVLRRTAALLADLKGKGTGTFSRNGPQGASQKRCQSPFPDLERELAEIQAANAAIDPKNVEARFVLFADACRVRREIALKNPLLGFDQVLFIKRHRSLYDHMCDQYYGMAARPGGGLYVLSGAFGPNPQVRDVLANVVVERGRLKGQKLSGGPTAPPALRFDGMGNVHGPEAQGGSFLSPDLAYDGRSIVFAYVECKGDQQHRHHTDATQGHWAEGRCYHVFKVNADGSGLEQLTDGTWNDFDPCWLPNGRIAFMSERRGGYLRCGRVCPTYTLFDMAADGSDITCLSFHETNEWHPSVTNDGRIIYTRWDYVDRFGCTAHHPWITTLDGRDSRAVHGNFAPRNMRPDMELDTRAIPGSQRFVATAAPHHGQAYGSLVLIDPNVPDDDAMAPIRRITPEVGFPESQGGAQVYGTPWPLSEDYYLCVYDSKMKPGSGFQGGQYQPGNYGIYLVDSFGNRELIYRDPEIACLSPMPLRATRRPVPSPELVQRGSDSNPATRPAKTDKQPEGTIALINVYDSIKPWPEGTKITGLRVLQVLPMSVPSGGPPHETAMRVALAGDSVVPVRYVLGTVPVEADGSAHFRVPANKEMFFQALDERGLAVQSMRSATYLHEGERLVCAGCHEPKYRSPQPPAELSLALRREPSRLKPDVDGSNPFSYPRLVQPVLDKHCVKCHAEKADKAPNLAREPLVGRWYASYSNLVGRFGFHDYGNNLRTVPGRFGAKASKLYELLQKDHYGVKLTEEEMHRITLWLDCLSMFYGVYEREGGEAQLRGEIARPTLE